MKNKLLAIAHKQARSNRSLKVTKDHIGLVVALMKEEITAAQFASALESNRAGNVGHYAYSILKKGLQDGLFKIVLK